MRWNHLIIAGAACLAMASGCGGGGGAANVSGRVTTFITDSMDGNDHVWVTIYSAELVASSGARATLFEDVEGYTVDLKTLRDGTGALFSLLGAESVPSGDYTTVRFTLDRQVKVFPAGQSTGINLTFAPAFSIPGQSGRSRLELAFGGTKTIAVGNNDLVIDFDLANWDDDGTDITPALREGTSNGLNDEGRHIGRRFFGTVSNLAGTAPDQSFTLTVRDTFSFTVVTDSQTTVFNSNGEANPSLANGQTVEVRGIYSLTSDALAAWLVRIRPPGDQPGEASVEGAPSNIGESTFDVAIREAHGFQPRQDHVTVEVGANTRFFSHSGLPMTQADFLAALATAQRVEAEGTYLNGTNRLVARKVKLDGENHEHEAEAKGAPGSINAAEHTFSITLSEWNGFSGSVGAILPVEMDQDATYRDQGGNTVDAETFFAALASAPSVEAEGHYVDGKLIARKAKLDD
ncbi:MAG: DUF4382 domain-containing protein [Fimbriimonadaceae bacterium]|nr:DUF4382 domain-containing protein [Fimbriimonadaceae bacterium]